MKKILTTCTAIFFASFLMAQNSAGFWKNVSDAQVQLPENAEIEQGPAVYRSVSLDMNAMVNYLRLAPMEFTGAAHSQPLMLELPAPGGGMETFAVWESPIMEPGLAAAYPMIKTFGGRSIENPAVTIRFSHTLHGFNAIVQTVGGTWYISPYATGQMEFYKCYWLKNVNFDPSEMMGDFCGAGHPEEEEEALHAMFYGENDRGAGPIVNLYTYRLAVATTGEYSNGAGGTVPSVLSSVTNVVNQVNSVFERDVAIRLVLIDNTTETFFFNAVTDPYTNGNTSAMIDQNPPALNAAYTPAGFDIGHVFGTNGGGLASLSSVCSFNKARGVSCRFGPYSGNLFYIVVGHEVGHQFNATHNFNKCDNENETPSTAYEPGSGSSIMCYNGNGVCGSNHLQDVTDDYFHINSIERIIGFSRNMSSGGSCAQVVVTGNNAPDVDIPIAGGFRIPISTPFELTGVATDPNGDNMTFVWEQYDLGPPSDLGNPLGTAPLFRSLVPGPSPTRVFPKMQTIVANASDPQEVLPTITRVLTFRFTARDNNPEGGGVAFQEIQFNATANAGPFLVTQPNAGGEIWEVGQYREVTWDVSNTDQAPVNCQWVNIRLSKDGGFTYPITLLAQTPNDGSAFVVVPDEVTTTARVRVEAADNIFFDISNQNFAIEPPSQPGFALLSSPEYGQVCIPDQFAVALQTTALLSFSEDITFTVEDLPAGATASFNNNPVAPGGEAILTINTDGVTDDGIFTITIKAEADSVPIAERTVDINFVYGNFSALNVISPADGASNQSGLPTFTWTQLPNALTYDIQISTDPTFSTVVDEATGLTASSYTPSLTLDDNTIYYWRIQPANECGSVGFIDPASFHTVSQSCETKQKSGGNVPISGLGFPYIQSKINIAESGVISDIKVRNIKGNHLAVGDLAFRLKNPAGDSVLLLALPTCGSPAFDMGFNDQSPTTTVGCPPNNGLTYKPAEPLALFNGGNVQGDWTLVVEVVLNGQGGTLQDVWELEYCASIDPKDPFLVKNDTLRVPPNDSRLIYQNRLVVDDEDNLPAQLQFTIVKNTGHGFVSLNGVQLGAGGKFTMQDVYSSAVRYTNTDPSATYDYFTFAVNDGAGGYFGTPRFNIIIDENADPVAVEETVAGRGFSLFPNPASGQVTAMFDRALRGRASVSILNVHGQLVQTRHFDNLTEKEILDISSFTSGIYFVQVKSGSGVFVKKLVIE